MAKPPMRRIPCDEYAVVVDGITYHPHEGESVWLAPSMSVAEMAACRSLARHEPALNAAKGEPDEGAVIGRILGETLDDACKVFAGLVLKWDLTDRMGDPLPQPAGDPAIIGRIDSALLFWLMGKMGEDGAARKNG